MDPLGLVLSVVLLMLLAAAFLRLRARGTASGAGLDDDHIRRIVEHGTLAFEEDEPLDESEIERAEDAFWDEERWDEAEEW
ncbi:MAG: hypothetical protein R3E98_13740 [Gemmatimonadota bacterium]